ncbi:hypothetical protein [Streptomyces sp. R08]|uniref:Uncharacterized protein n=1 Tax=Streptomyces sp. R08 TaxID=3238624 RepID=A0AB39LZC6_9ACTN
MSNQHQPSRPGEPHQPGQPLLASGAPQPSAGHPLPLQNKRSKAKTVAIVCAGVFGGLVVVGIIANIVDPPKKTASVKVPPVATSSSAGPTPHKTLRKPTAQPRSTPSKQQVPITSTYPTHTIRALPAVQLVFSGGLAGQVSQAVNVRPVKTGASYDYTPPDWATQCVMPAKDGAWSADISFRFHGLIWEITIGQPGFGRPKPGSHPALQETVTGGSGDDPKAVSIAVQSAKSPGGDFDTYYPPMDHNNGTGTVTINSGLTSGTLDVWNTPSYPDPLEFRIKGRWSCNK